MKSLQQDLVSLTRLLLLSQVILLLSWVNYEPYVVDDYTYPPYANGIGWAIAMLIILMVPIGFVYNIAHEQKGGIMEVSNCDGRSA